MGKIEIFLQVPSSLCMQSMAGCCLKVLKINLQNSLPLQDRPEHILCDGEQGEYEPVYKPVCVVLPRLRLNGSNTAIGGKHKPKEQAAQCLNLGFLPHKKYDLLGADLLLQT